MGLSQSFPSKQGGKARPCPGFHFTVQKRPLPGLVVPLWAKRPNLKSGTEAHPGGKNFAGDSASTSSADTRSKGAPDVSQSLVSPSSSSVGFQVGILSHFLDQWRSITSNRFVFNMVQGHHLQLMSHPSLFCNFWQSSVKLTAAHHPII